jgi:DNA-binding transcriptional MerR regulator
MSTNGHTEFTTGKSLFRIGEVSRLTDTKPFVLRYWETEFPMLQPVKSPKGHRLYRREDVETVLVIKRLLYDEGFTIAGARRHLHEATGAGVSHRHATEVNAADHERQSTHFSHEARSEASAEVEGGAPAEIAPKVDQGLFSRNQAPAQSPINRKLLLELRDSLRAFLTALENE